MDWWLAWLLNLRRPAGIKTTPHSTPRMRMTTIESLPPAFVSGWKTTVPRLSVQVVDG